MAEASGGQRLVRDQDPVSQPVHPVLKLAVALQVGLHLAHLVQQLTVHLEEGEERGGTRLAG